LGGGPCTITGRQRLLFIGGSPATPGLPANTQVEKDLYGGELKLHTDFRSVYAAALQDWLNVDSEPTLGRKYNKVKLLLPIILKS